MDERDVNDPWSESPPRKSWGRLIVVMLLAAVVGCGITLFVFHNNQQAVGDAVRGTEGRLTLADDDGKSLELVDRQQNPEIWYRVMLADAPIGEKLNLSCEWVGPDGKVVQRNRYTTQPIDRANWPTHARHRFEPNSAVGAWTVRLMLGDRVLQSTTFAVQDGGKPGKGAP